MKHRFLILANNSGGLYGFRKELIDQLLQYGEVYASTPFDDKIEELKKQGCRLIETNIDRRGLNPIKDLKLLNYYSTIIHQVNPDLVISYTIKPNIYGGLIAQRLGIPYIANVTGLGTAFEKDNILKKFVIQLYRRALKNTKTVFFENTANMQLFIGEKIIRKEQGYTLHGAGVNTHYYDLSQYPDNEVMHFLFVGRMMKEKGIDELLEAVVRLNNQYPCVLDIVGRYEEDYIERIKKLEKEGIVKFHGYQQDVRPYIADCSCFVLPSYHEGMANTLLECASMGRPLITSDIPGCREAVIDGETGFLCKAKDSDSLYNAMKSFMELSYDKRKAMGIAGRQHMEAVFAKEKVVDETIKRINTVMNWKEEND